jgi:fatty-acyl-CoA synthase
MTRISPYQTGLDKNAANHVPLSPMSFLGRTAAVFPDRVALIHGELRQTWRETEARCRRLASALARHGVGPGVTVAAMLPNTPAMFEAHYGVPMAGGVLNTLNTRLDAEAIAFMLEHGEARVLLVDPEFAPTVARALQAVEPRHRPLVVDVLDTGAPETPRLGTLTYDELLAQGDPQGAWQLPADEWDAIALNYTSGTTGNPKGVVTHHRGAYLNAANNVIAWQLPDHPVYLWTLPCSIATAGASPGPWRWWAAPACACAAWSRPPCGS